MTIINNSPDGEMNLYINALNEKLTTYFGYEIEIYFEDTDNLLSIRAKADIGDQNVKLFKKITESLKLCLEDKEIKLPANRELDNLIEDISIDLLFDTTELCNSESYSTIYDFIRHLISLSFRTYELSPTNAGLLIIKNDINDTISKLNLDYHPVDGYSYLDFIEMIETEKPLLRLIDNKSIIFVLNSELCFTGYARKKIGFLNIDEVIENNINQKCINTFKLELKKLYNNYYESLINEDMKDANIGKIYEQLIVEHPEENYTKTLVKSMFESVQNIYRENFIEYDVDNKEEVESTDYIYIKILNKEIQFTANPTFSILYKKGNWIIREYYSIMKFIFMQFMKQHLICNQEKYEEIVKKTNYLLNLVKLLSSNNVGGLIVILDEDENINKLIDANKNRDYAYKKIINSDKENLLELDVSLVCSIISIDGATILDCDLNILCFGELIKNTSEIAENISKNKATAFGARTDAAFHASRYGLAIKISEDGDIELFSKNKKLLKV